MMTSAKPLWKRVLFYRIAEWDRRVLRWLLQLRTPLRRMPAIDLWWLRWLITLAGALCLANLARMFPLWDGVATVANIVVGAGLAVYFIHLLFWRLQCSLLEFWVMVGLLVNVEGLLLTSPSLKMLNPAWVAALVLIAAAWVFAGAVRALSAARVLGVSTASGRVLMLLVGWLTSAAPALLLLGGLITFGPLAASHGVRGETISLLIAPWMAKWGITMLALGLIGVVAHVKLTRQINRVASQLLRFK